MLLLASAAEAEHGTPWHTVERVPSPNDDNVVVPAGEAVPPGRRRWDLSADAGSWGDIDCGGSAALEDALIFLMLLEQLLIPSRDCHPSGAPVQTEFGEQQWWDWDCDGMVAGADVAPLLRQAAGLPASAGVPGAWW